MNLPNRLTLARIGTTALFVMALLLPRFPYGKTVALALFIVASLSDWFDGWYARRHNLVTAFGALLDPVADKILVCAAFICFVEMPDHHGHALVQAWMTLVIVAREFLVTGLRLVAREQGLVLQAEQLGKHKTASQMVAIIVILTGLAARDEWGLGSDAFNTAFSVTVLWGMVGVVALTLWSGVSYFWKNRESFLRDA